MGGQFNTYDADSVLPTVAVSHPQPQYQNGEPGYSKKSVRIAREYIPPPEDRFSYPQLDTYSYFDMYPEAGVYYPAPRTPTRSKHDEISGKRSFTAARKNQDSPFEHVAHAPPESHDQTQQQISWMTETLYQLQVEIQQLRAQSKRTPRSEQRSIPHEQLLPHQEDAAFDSEPHHSSATLSAKQITPTPPTLAVSEYKKYRWVLEEAPHTANGMLAPNPHHDYMSGETTRPHLPIHAEHSHGHHNSIESSPWHFPGQFQPMMPGSYPYWPRAPSLYSGHPSGFDRASSVPTSQRQNCALM